MNAEPTGATALIWLTLCKQGGYLSAIDLKASEPKLAHVSLTPYLQSMVKSGRIRKRDRAGQQPEYGVTTGCGVPDGVTVGELIRDVIRPGESPTTAIAKMPRGREHSA